MDENNNKLMNVEQPDSLTQERSNVPPASSIGDASSMIESLLSNSHIPKRLQKQLWIFFSRSTKISFLNDKEVNDLMWEFELIRLTIIESIPKADYNEDLELELEQIRMEFKLNLNRSKGGAMNERTLLGASTQATFSERPMGRTSGEPGFLDKIANMFR